MLRMSQIEMAQSGAEMVKAQSQMQSLIHNVADAVIQFNADSTVAAFNLAAEKTFGYAEIEMLYQSPHKIFPCPDSFNQNVMLYLDEHCQSTVDQYATPLRAVNAKVVKKCFCRCQYRKYHPVMLYCLMTVLMTLIQRVVSLKRFFVCFMILLYVRKWRPNY